MKHKRKIIYLAGFLFYLPIAFASYINSSFLSLFVGVKLVSIIYALGSAVSIITLLAVPKLIQKLGGYKFLVSIAILDALSFLILALTNNSFTIVVAFILGITLNTLITFSLDEFLKIFSKESSTGRIRGIYLATTNLAWIFSQVATGIYLGQFSFQTIYLVSFFIMLGFAFVSFIQFKNIPDPTYDKIETLQYLKRFIANKNLFRIYIINFILQLFFCLMVIYTPFYLSTYLHFSWKHIGVIFAIMLLPFSILPFRLGKISDKIGERKILMLGFLIASISTMYLFLLDKSGVLFWALALFATRVGASTIETMSDTYFFKHIRPENEEYIGVYRSASPFAYIVGPLVALAIFSLTPSFNYIYIILGAIMLSGMCLASRIQKGDI